MNSTTPAPLPAAAQAVVAALVAARRTGPPALATPALAQALSCDDDAYAVQDAVAAKLHWFDQAPPRYWKSGGASRQAPLAHAALPASGVRSAGDAIAGLRWNAPFVEAEIALRLARPVTPEQAQRLRPEDAAALVDAIAVAIEIADSRWQQGLQAPAALRLADQGSHGALLLGPWQPARGRDWAGQRCTVHFGTGQAADNLGAYPLADPLWLLPQWLRHATRGARGLPAHSVVTTGSWVGAIAMPADGQVEVRFAGLGTVGLRAGRVYGSAETQ